MTDTMIERIRNTSCFLLDMDGTFYLGERVLEGSLSFLDALEEKGKQAIFLTNNSSKSGAFYVDRLKRMGVDEPFLRVITSGQATARYVLDEFPNKRAYLLGNRSLASEMLQMGVLLDAEKPDYVIVAFDTELDYAKMEKVCTLVRKGVPYIATHPDFNCPTEHGFIPDIGAIMAFIEASTGRKADMIIGKPYTGIVSDVLRHTEFQEHELAMVGDRLYTDIATGVNFGMLSILVLTGETTMPMLEASDIQPDITVERLSSLIPYL